VGNIEAGGPLQDGTVAKSVPDLGQNEPHQDTDVNRHRNGTHGLGKFARDYGGLGEFAREYGGLGELARAGAAPQTSASNVVTFTPTNEYSDPASLVYDIADELGSTAATQTSLVTREAEQNAFTANSISAVKTLNDSSLVNLGIKFQAEAAGWISGSRVYKGASNSGPHTGFLWTADGPLLASAVFTDESASGWRQSARPAQLVATEPNRTSVVSCSANGSHSASGNFYNSEVLNSNLRALASAQIGGNGAYASGASGLFPTNSFNSADYVDLAFRPQLVG
jgi:hypothetical protein